MSARLSRRSTAAAADGGFAAEVGRGQQISIDSCCCHAGAGRVNFTQLYFTAKCDSKKELKKQNLTKQNKNNYSNSLSLQFVLCYLKRYLLFKTILKNSYHVLYPYLPENQYRHYHLRQRLHNKALIPKTTYLSDRDYIMRMLYKNCY